jgi:peptidoglycan/xylan/chitin deacetylase (PgdA/CDA1 family)
MRFKIVNNLPIRFHQIVQRKKIILFAIILGLTAIFILAMDKPAISKKPQEFVISAAENSIQPPAADATFANLPAAELRATLSRPCDFPLRSDSTLTPPFERKIRVPVLMYHHIAIAPEATTLPGLYHSPAIFESQLVSLQNNCYQTVFIRDLARALDGSESLPSQSLALTFDDGYDDIYLYAFPLLKKYQMKGTMYIIVNALDTPGYLTKEQVREMADSGYVEIASHTLNHANLSQSSYSQAYYQIIDSKKELEKIIGRTVDDFAYPYGYFTSRDEQLCGIAGYLSCVSTYPGDVQNLLNRYSLYRLRPGYRVGPALLSWLEFVGSRR